MSARDGRDAGPEHMLMMENNIAIADLIRG